MLAVHVLNALFRLICPSKTSLLSRLPRSQKTEPSKKASLDIHSGAFLTKTTPFQTRETLSRAKGRRAKKKPPEGGFL